jgi:antitoxin VapB
VIVALRERLDRTRRNRGAGLASEILRIGKECAGLPVLDERSPDEILSYEPDGLPH